jgi:hypothetical protein
LIRIVAREQTRESAARCSRCSRSAHGRWWSSWSRGA